MELDLLLVDLLQQPQLDDPGVERVKIVED
jgi:hypothetical protein